MEDELPTPFIIRSPFRPDQRANSIEHSVVSIERDLDFIKIHGYDEFVKQRIGQEANADDGEDGNGLDGSTMTENLGSSFEGTLRDYQIYMLERAKVENVIVHLGTGMGKTLISIFLIKEQLSQMNSQRKEETDDDKAHILFLVPSIALAVQQTDTLRANLHCVVATACHTSSHSSKAREEIAAADVIVATHGSALDLFRHYPDVLSMMKVELMVMDECHYATGKHNYATILKDFYHPLLREDRPRVLGMTASPLINVGVRVTESQLQMLLSEFERIMDARLLGFPSNIVSCGQGRKKEAEESVVPYKSEADVFVTTLPQAQWDLLHKSRKKEIDQLQHLCNEVGLRVTAVYALALQKEIGQNEFEEETPQQLESLKSYLMTVVNHSRRLIKECRAGPYGGHTHKTKKLEDLLTDAVKLRVDGPDQQAPVGIVFVERRMMAIALCSYFCNRMKNHESSAHVDAWAPSFGMENTKEHSSDSTKIGASRLSLNSKMDSQVTPEPYHPIKCDVVVRQATQVFKYLARQNKFNPTNQNQLDDDWVHQRKRIRTVIKKLRCRETNVLVATSVVEEGVDIEACRFIISFDGLKTIKSYIQMKGRARQKNAQFFVFVEQEMNKAQPLSLDDAQKIEGIIHTFIARKQREMELQPLPTLASIDEHPYSSDEEAAMHFGQYMTTISKVDLSSFKSLLNRYAMSVPVEPNCRTSKKAAVIHMPIYSENKLILPSHLPPNIREVGLPILFRGEAKKKKQSLLALAACVRLHKFGLLNDRLLPLDSSDMKKWLLEKSLIELPSCKRRRQMHFESPVTVYIYSINQSGDRFDKEERVIRNENSGGIQLAFISLSQLPENLPLHSFYQKELGLIECWLSYCGKMVLSKREWKDLSDFHCIVFNSRWRQRRKKTKRFLFDEGLFPKSAEAFSPCVIGCLKTNTGGCIDWMLIRKTIAESSRSFAVTGDCMLGPRVWSPIYNHGVSYVVYGPSGNICMDMFPGEDYETFQDYYTKRYALTTSSTGKLFLAKRLWEFPQTLGATQDQSFLNEDIKDIPMVELPQELCFESPLADPVIMLHSIVLPQLVYQLEQYLTATSFIEHCACNFPILEKCLSELTIDLVMEALTAKSCSLNVTYDRLEWLGDAVLKLLHTDALLKFEYTSYLHEGYLSMLRSEMGCNDRLTDIAKAAGFDRFILLKPLNRGEWCPFGLRYCEHDEDVSDHPVRNNDDMLCAEPSMKVCADVIESLIGLVFIEFGYEQCMGVTYEMALSFCSGNIDKNCRKWSNVSSSPDLTSFACDFVGVPKIFQPHLLVEATTHQTCLHKPAPSYQRLEWIGDTVLCLAAREWLFRREEKLSVPKLVVLETTLVCNESLAYIGYTQGLHQFIDHRNSALPGRFQSYQLDLNLGRGLWSTDPPKVIPDVIEALIGAVHVDQGYYVAQKAALHVIHPLTQSISNLLASDCNNLAGLLHPKHHLYEMTGGIVSVCVYKHDLFLHLGFSSPLMNFGDGDSDAGYVGVVSCKRILLAAVVEASRNRAVNVACELAVQILKDKPSIIPQLQSVHSISTEQK